MISGVNGWLEYGFLNMVFKSNANLQKNWISLSVHRVVGLFKRHTSKAPKHYTKERPNDQSLPLSNDLTVPQISYLCLVQKSEFIAGCNAWASKGSPFLFIIDYELENFQIMGYEEAAERGIYFDIQGLTNTEGSRHTSVGEFHFNISPMDFKDYETAFSLVRKNIIHGNSFLLNLTFPTPIETNLNLQQVFYNSKAPYKILYKDRFVVFSPETFVKTENDYIFSYPMKGTIDAALPDAEKMLLENEKEYMEHITIVDLIRNDLSIVSKEVSVTKFRYIEEIKTHKNALLQLSSEIRGKLPRDWQKNMGTILLKLLPAGSISGAPKRKTTEIIAIAEGQKRGYFTGIFGIFDGKNLNSGVMIRYIEKKDEGLQFRSGGGITGNSEPLDEYNEMIDKVYVPII